MTELNSYQLSRNWFNFCFDNPDIIKPIHTAIYFFAIEHCNRLGWKDKFGFPSQMVMEAIGVKNWRTYSKGLYDIIDFGFIKMIEKSTNQYSSNVIAIVKNTKAQSKALDKALQKHSQKQVNSIVSINKQETKNKEQVIPSFDEFKNYALENESSLNIQALELKYKAWIANDWKDGYDKQIKNWKSKLLNTILHLPKNSNGQKKEFNPNDLIPKIE